MQAEDGYDTTQFDALRRVLGTLNERALADGLVAVRDGVVVTPVRRKRRARKAAAAEKKKTAKPAKKSPDRSAAAATRLLALLRRQDGDESPAVAGTDFTEAGVTRLLAHLRRRGSKRGGAWLRFQRRANRYLSRPVTSGVRTIQGIGFERLQVLVRQFEEIESSGWAGYRASRAARRRKVVPSGALDQEAATAPAKPRRKGKTR